MKFFYTYVLISKKDAQFYIGFSQDVIKRLKDHNSAKVISTKNRIPLELFYFEAFKSKKDALRRERYFKTNKGKTTLRQMNKESLKTADS